MGTVIPTKEKTVAQRGHVLCSFLKMLSVRTVDLGLGLYLLDHSCTSWCSPLSTPDTAVSISGCRGMTPNEFHI